MCRFEGGAMLFALLDAMERRGDVRVFSDVSSLVGDVIDVTHALGSKRYCRHEIL